jgi:CrcB protein
MRITLAVALGSAAGGMARYAVSRAWIMAAGGSWIAGDILLVNASGSFGIGLVAALTGVSGRWYLPPHVRQGLLTGFFGGYTTFSFFSWHLLQALAEQRWMAALAYVLATFSLSLGAVWLGYGSGMRLQQAHHH